MLSIITHRQSEMLPRKAAYPYFFI